MFSLSMVFCCPTKENYSLLSQNDFSVQKLRMVLISNKTQSDVKDYESKSSSFTEYETLINLIRY